MPIQAGYHSRGYLPHLKVSGAAYFVTFRLADSLPQELVRRLKEQRADLLHRAARENQDELATRRELHVWYAAEVDSILDQHTGAAWLRDPRIAELTASAVQYFSGKRYKLHAWCTVPNHVHVVLQPLATHTLDGILHNWKSYTANHANKLLDRTGQPFWRRETYDHWIRVDAELAHHCAYTEQNPVKARLCTSATDWPWSSAAKK